MTLDEATEVVNVYQLERNINTWVSAVIRMRNLKKPTPVQAEASAVIEAWFDDVLAGRAS